MIRSSISDQVTFLSTKKSLFIWLHFATKLGAAPEEIWTIRPEKETIYNSYLNITRKYLYFVVYQLLVYSELINYNSSFKLEKIIKDYLQQHHKLLRIVWRSQLPLCWR